MKAWLLSIVGVVMLSLLLDILLPSGKLNKYIKGVFAMIVVLVLITPFAGIVAGSTTINDFFDFNAVETESYGNLMRFDEGVLNSNKERIKKELEKEGIEVVDIKINISNGNNFEITSVYITVQTNADENKVKSCVMKNLTVDKEQIYVYGVN